MEHPSFDVPPDSLQILQPCVRYHIKAISRTVKLGLTCLLTCLFGRDRRPSPQCLRLRPLLGKLHLLSHSVGSDAQLLGLADLDTHHKHESESV